MDEKKDFARRLRAAMIAAGYEPRPSVLEKHFNARYWGRSISYQATRRWLLGLSVPTQEKLQVLADWLRVEPQALRYGTHTTSGRSAGRENATGPGWASITAADRDFINAYLSLPEPLREHLRAFVKALH